MKTQIEILEVLKKSKLNFDDLISNYQNYLPEEILDGAKRNYFSEMPSKINTFFKVIGKTEWNVKDVDEAIAAFEDKPIEEAISDSISKAEKIFYVPLTKETKTIEEIIEHSKYIIREIGILLSFQLAFAKERKQSLGN